MPIDDEQLEQLKAKYGDDIVERETKWGDVVAFRLPTLEEWERCVGDLQDEQSRFHAQKVLVKVCAIWPDKEAFEKLLRRRPGLVATFWNDLSAEVGLGQQALRKK